ncbi:MAG: EpsI family protein [Alphaproteobacteria bacterium]|nr:EpsI family protein [Alphaproteobacteria bacterium]
MATTFFEPRSPNGPNIVIWGDWFPAIVGIVLGAAAIFSVFSHTTIEAVTLWYERSSYNYAFLVIPISLYLIYERRDGLVKLRPEPAWWGLLGMVAMGALWLVADAIDVSVGRHFAVVGMLQSLLLCVLGWRVYWFLLFPLMFLWLLVPTGDFLLPSLQKIAMALSVFGLELTGIPIFSEGFTVETPTGTYVVAPGCAGLNFLLAGLAFSLLYGNLQYQSRAKQIASVLVMLVVAIISNGIRIVGIIAIAHVTERELNIVDDHLLYGWGFFAIILLALIWIGARFQDPLRDYAAAVTPSPRRRSKSPYWAGVVAIAAVGIAASAPSYAAWRSASNAAGWGEGAQIMLTPPESFGDWRRVENNGAWRPATPAAHLQTVWSYRRGAQTIDLAIGYFWTPSPEADVVAEVNSLVDDKVWRRVVARHGMAEIGGQALSVVGSRIRSRSRERLAWQVYWVDGGFTSSRIVAKLHQAKAMFLGGEMRAAYVSASIPIGGDPDVEAGAAVLRDFFSAAATLPDLLSSAQKTTR